MYTADGQPDRTQLVTQYTPLVRRIAHHLMMRLPANVHLDDVIQNGMVGLLDALERYEEGFGAQFETYASQRIRGAMLDGLRENDWMPRNVRREMRRVEGMIQKLEQSQGRPPSESELAESLAMPLPDYQKLLYEARGHQLVYLEDFSSEEGDDYLDRHLGSEASDPSRLFEDQDMRQELVVAIGALPERERVLMALYYEEELNLREIGEVLGITESRVCQLHSQAISRIRSRVFGEVSQSGKAASKSRRKVKDVG